MPADKNFPDIRLSIFNHIVEELLVVSDGASLSEKDMAALEDDISRVAHIVMHILGIQINGTEGDSILATLTLQQVDTLEQ